MIETPVDTLATRFHQFAAAECGDEPLYAALCDAIASDDAALRLLWAAPPEQQRPNLLLAAVHDLLLAGAEDPLRAYFPGLAGARAIDGELGGALADFLRHHDAALRRCLATRTTQTNEVGRCAVLWPALRAIAAHLGRSRVALIDVGCSAGLNLAVDRYRYDYGEFALGPRDAAVTIPCRLVGERRPTPERDDGGDASVEIAARLGLDPAPIDVNDPIGVRWLQACIWPHDHERRARLDRAVASARRTGFTVRREADCTAALTAVVAALPADLVPVIFNSWVLAYLSPDALARHHDAMRALVERGAVWLSAEGANLRLGDAVTPAAVEPGLEYREGTLWTLCVREADRLRYTVVARSHPHGKWMQWLGSPEGDEFVALGGRARGGPLGRSWSEHD